MANNPLEALRCFGGKYASISKLFVSAKQPHEILIYSVSYRKFKMPCVICCCCPLSLSHSLFIRTKNQWNILAIDFCIVRVKEKMRVGSCQDKHEHLAFYFLHYKWKHKSQLIHLCVDALYRYAYILENWRSCSHKSDTELNERRFWNMTAVKKNSSVSQVLKLVSL